MKRAAQDRSSKLSPRARWQAPGTDLESAYPSGPDDSRRSVDSVVSATSDNGRLPLFMAYQTGKRDNMTAKASRRASAGNEHDFIDNFDEANSSVVKVGDLLFKESPALHFVRDNCKITGIRTAQVASRFEKEGFKRAEDFANFTEKTISDYDLKYVWMFEKTEVRKIREGCKAAKLELQVAAFKELDVDGSGALDIDEVVNGAHLLNMTPEAARILFQQIDTSGSNQVDIDKFVNAYNELDESARASIELDPTTRKQQMVFGRPAVFKSTAEKEADRKSLGMVEKGTEHNLATMAFVRDVMKIGGLRTAHVSSRFEQLGFETVEDFAGFTEESVSDKDLKYVWMLEKTEVRKIREACVQARLQVKGSDTSPAKEKKYAFGKLLPSMSGKHTANYEAAMAKTQIPDDPSSPTSRVEKRGSVIITVSATEDFVRDRMKIGGLRTAHVASRFEKLGYMAVEDFARFDEDTVSDSDLKYIWQLEKTEVRKIREACQAARLEVARKNFEAIDVDGSGTLSLKEVVQAAHLLNMDKKTAKAWFEELDEGEGEVSMEVFLQKYEELGSTVQKPKVHQMRQKFTYGRVGASGFKSSPNAKEKEADDWLDELEEARPASPTPVNLQLANSKTIDFVKFEMKIAGPRATQVASRFEKLGYRTLEDFASFTEKTVSDSDLKYVWMLEKTEVRKIRDACEAARLEVRMNNFKKIDTNGSGTLDLGEVVNSAHLLNMTPEAARDFFFKVDADGSGEVEMDEFLHMYEELDDKEREEVALEKSKRQAFVFGKPAVNKTDAQKEEERKRIGMVERDSTEKLEKHGALMVKTSPIIDYVRGVMRIEGLRTAHVASRFEKMDFTKASDFAIFTEKTISDYDLKYVWMFEKTEVRKIREACQAERTRARMQSFAALDTDGSGTIGLQELLEGCSLLNMDQNTARRWFEEIDVEGNGEVPLAVILRKYEDLDDKTREDIAVSPTMKRSRFVFGKPVVSKTAEEAEEERKKSGMVERDPNETVERRGSLLVKTSPTLEFVRDRMKIGGLRTAHVASRFEKLGYATVSDFARFTEDVVSDSDLKYVWMLEKTEVRKIREACDEAREEVGVAAVAAKKPNAIFGVTGEASRSRVAATTHVVEVVGGKEVVVDVRSHGAYKAVAKPDRANLVFKTNPVMEFVRDEMKIKGLRTGHVASRFEKMGFKKPEDFARFDEELVSDSQMKFEWGFEKTEIRKIRECCEGLRAGGIV